MRDFKIEDYNNPNIQTKDGRKVRIICTDRLTNNVRGVGSIIGLVKGKSGKFEQIIQYDKNGKQINCAKEYDLVINEDN